MYIIKNELGKMMWNHKMNDRENPSTSEFNEDNLSIYLSLSLSLYIYIYVCEVMLLKADWQLTNLGLHVDAMRDFYIAKTHFYETRMNAEYDFLQCLLALSIQHKCKMCNKYFQLAIILTF